jgi:hypothetical protein
MVGIIGTVQTTETIKVLLNINTSLQGRLLLPDTAAMEWRGIKLPPYTNLTLRLFLIQGCYTSKMTQFIPLIESIFS